MGKEEHNVKILLNGASCVAMMRSRIAEFKYFFQGLWIVMFQGGKLFYGWMAFLTILILGGVWAYSHQLLKGLIVTNMRDQVSWGFYISNFTFMVGVAAAAVLLIIPAYFYSFKSIKKIVVFGELLAISAILMALSFIFVDFGRGERFWHALPFIGTMNFPHSILAWDVLVLNWYLALNLFIALYMSCHTYFGKTPNKYFIVPLILLSIPSAVGIHTVTAFVYNGLAARSFWNASILAPRFLASAFCSGPALMILIFQVLRRTLDVKIENRAIMKLAEIIAYAMAINIFLLLAEVYKEYYSGTMHLASMKYLFQGLDGHSGLVPWIWTAIGFNTAAFLLFLIPKMRNNIFILNIGCVLIFIGVWIEKGMGLVIPGFIPDTAGEIYEYSPSRIEWIVFLGICAFGAMTYTLFARAAIAIDTGKLRHPEAPPVPLEESEDITARTVMTRNLITATSDTTVEEISKLLVTHRISGVPVVDKENRVIGVVSESDIILKEIYSEPHLVERLGEIIMPPSRQREKTGGTALEIMTSPAITAQEETPVRELVRIISDNKIKRVIIVDKEGHPKGIVSRMDIVRVF
jgi:Ni/Fe-hydrogenase subunit HybB-like protein/CBS domain-containing protein